MSSLNEFASAIERGDSSIVESLISNGSVDANARLPRAFEPPALVFALRHRRPEIVKILLRYNARVNETDNKGWTACHAAARGLHDVLALLLARQPNLAAVDVDGKTAFRIALTYCLNDDGRCALMLLEAGASLESVDRGELCEFASKSTVAIRTLIDRGVNVREIVGTSGMTPLHQAAFFTRDADVFDLLVNVCGIDLNSRCHDGGTCILWAASARNDVSLR
jgi:ankyrin repeat protein